MENVFYTEARSKGYDFVHIYYHYGLKEIIYTLFLNYKNSDLWLDLYEGEKRYLPRREFDKILNSYKKDMEYDLSHYDPDHRESFYRDCPFCDCDDEIDLLQIDYAKKKYSINYGVCECTDGYDMIGNPIFPTYVSSRVFDVIVAGLSKKGFVKVEKFDIF